MKNKRRDFLKVAGLAGIGMLGTTSSMGKSFSHVQYFNMSGYGAPGMDIVRVGIIGVGQRGPTYIHTMGRIEGVDIRAICDLRPEKVEEAKNMAKKLGHQPFVYSGDRDILPLSSWSVHNHSNSIQIPDFTAGAWKSNERNMDVELKNHGNTVMR